MISLLIWGGWGFLPKLASIRATASAIFVLEIAGAVAVGGAILALSGIEFHPLGALLAFTAGLCSYAGVFIYICILRERPVGIVSALTGMYVLVTAVLGMVFLSEEPTLPQAAGIALALAALWLLNVPSKRKPESHKPGETSESSE